ncbi:hypothetical protein DIPPA_24484 [Diplonema papillatum]|nr:hypothetical protein DIPPA_24484 [Diplonema papillatum]
MAEGKMDDAAVLAAIEETNAEIKTNPTILRRYLSDRGEWTLLCDKALASVDNSIRDAEDLRQALSCISRETEMNPVESDEAADMFLPNLTTLEFYHLAKSYFLSLASSLDFDDNWGGLIGNEDA